MIHERIREARQQRGWTQAQLAEHSGITLGYIKQLEGGHKPNPTQDTLHKLARALDVPVSTLLGEADELAGPLPAAKLRSWGVSEAEITQYSAAWPYWSRKQRATFLGDLEMIRRARANVQALTDEVQAKVRALENKANQDDDPDSATQPFAGQVAL
jgi:transcriptional regulator with XRE-family HTH domain